MNTSPTGIVFNIQKYSVHDGEGIRTIVFLKGCPLRCMWCCNPESQHAGPERVFNAGKCLTMPECGMCRDACPSKAISDLEGYPCVDPKLCKGCLTCVATCPSGAFNVYGEKMTVEQVLDRVEQDAVFYSRSGGGLTLSGGEATCQPEFARALLIEARRRRLHCAMETCGHCDTKTFLEICGLLDQLIFDIKLLDPERHKRFTGVDNALILKNFAAVLKAYPELPVHVRTPVVPDVNDNEADISAILDVLPRRRGVTYELMAYHRMGQPKYGYLGREFPMGDRALDKSRLRRLNALVEIWNVGKQSAMA